MADMHNNRQLQDKVKSLKFPLKCLFRSDREDHEVVSSCQVDGDLEKGRKELETWKVRGPPCHL